MKTFFNLFIFRRMENAAKDGGVKIGSQESLKKNGSRPIDSGVDSGPYTSDSNSYSRSLSSHNSAEGIAYDSSVCSLSTHRAIHTNSQLHCSSSLSTTRHLHSSGHDRNSRCSFTSSLNSSSVPSSDSGFSAGRRGSCSERDLFIPEYFPTYSHVFHKRRTASGFPANSAMLIMDYQHFHTIPFNSEEHVNPRAMFGIELYHNSSSIATPLGQSRSIHENLAGAVVRTKSVQVRKHRRRSTLTIDQLRRVKILGRGGYAHVELMTDLDGNSYALKCINKTRVVEAGQRRHVKAEREILLDIDSCFILKLFKTFRDKKYVYLLTEALLGGELFTLMKRSGPLDEHRAMFAMACVVEAIDYLHKAMVRF
jgi:hypothetical protein